MKLHEIYQALEALGIFRKIKELSAKCDRIVQPVMSAASTFLGLTDTPTSYIGKAGKVLKVNSTETGIEFQSESGGVQSIVAGSNISIDNTDPVNPIVSSLADRYKTTSTTSHTIVPTGTLTFTVNANLAYTSQQDVMIVHDSNNHMHGTVNSYSGTSLVIDITHKTGTGTYASWVINLDGLPVSGGGTWGSITGTLSSQTDLQTALNNKWNTTGNTNTNPDTDFIGTTDAQPLRFNTNGTERVKIETNGNVIIGGNTTISKAGDVSHTVTTTSTSDSRASIFVHGNASNARGQIIIKGNHDGFDGTQTGDGGCIFSLWHNAASGNPQKMTWTSYNGGIKLDVENNGSGGSITGFVKFTKEGYIQMNLPTSSAGLPSGTLWNDGGVVKIV